MLIQYFQQQHTSVSLREVSSAKYILDDVRSGRNLTTSIIDTVRHARSADMTIANMFGFDGINPAL